MGIIIKVNGKPQEVISEKIITGYPHETNLEMRRRHKRNEPKPKYQYTAVRVR